MVQFNGRVALVTGAGRGIGRSVALALAAEGAAVALWARSAGELEATAGEIRAAGGAAHLEAVDITDLARVRSALSAVEDALGAVDILVNNAGIAESAPLHRTTDDLWDRTYALNVRAPFALSRLVIPGMRARRYGRIINIASTAALRGYAYTAAYTASKHALLGMTRAFSKELVALGITVNAVCPGYVDTAITRAAAENIAAKTGRSVEQALADLASQSPLGRLVGPEEVAHAVLLLAARDSGAISGQALSISGGAVEG